ncbi:MAG: zinc-dependent alcohol dehydrogenase family protein [Gammaproteobacteria bacterium]|nr:zinc-dependent alcohol dehydrogenase family protein [Gammaproteobacteria bacterium]
MAKIVRFYEQGGPEVLKLEEAEVGAPGEGELRIRVQAIGLNRSEAMFRRGGYFAPNKYPSLNGYECSGIVEALGPGVDGFTVGQNVSVLPMWSLGQYGVYGEQAIVPARAVVAAPPGLTPIEAASVWMQYFTAYAIIEWGRLTIGDYVILPAASSSVGLAAIQLANWAGATPIATTRRSDKAGALLGHGAAHVIATEEQDLVEEVMRITDGKGARVVFDPVGGPYVETLAKAMAEEGLLMIYGSLSGQPTPHPHWSSAFKAISVRSWIASQIWNKPQRFAAVSAVVLKGLAEGQLQPVIARTFGLEQIVDAHRYLESNQQIGKVVVTVGDVTG